LLVVPRDLRRPDCRVAGAMRAQAHSRWAVRLARHGVTGLEAAAGRGTRQRCERTARLRR
jgi:hypothetical protein